MTKSTWSLRATTANISHHAGDRMIAWYVASPITWSFRSVPDGEQVIIDHAARLADLVGAKVRIRVTSRPYPVHAWAMRAWANAAEPQPGFDEMMRRDQVHMGTRSQATKLVFYGIELPQRSSLVKGLAKLSPGAADRELAGLQDRLAQISLVMSGAGLYASPATQEELDWLIRRSLALGCPVPDTGDVVLPAMAEDDIAAVTSTVAWSADALGASTTVVSSMAEQQITRHVVVLTLTRMEDIDVPRSQYPWMALTDQLPFQVEWSALIMPRDPTEVAKEVTRLSNRIEAQISHWKSDHGKIPPKQLARQQARSLQVQDEMRSNFSGRSTRTRAWIRVAVWGDTEDQALARAAKVQQLYNPWAGLAREIGQYWLAREFVPGEPLANQAHTRHWPALKIAAGLPAVTSQIGDDRGFHIGETAGGGGGRAVVFDPYYLTEVLEMSGLIPVCGEPGSGKSVLLGMLLYKLMMSGVRGVALDPAGRMQRMCQLPEIARLAVSKNLLGGDPGSLSPYAAVPEPNLGLIMIDAEEQGVDWRDRLARDTQAAQESRRDLALMCAVWSLPYERGQNDKVREALRRTILRLPADRHSSLDDVINVLKTKGDFEEGIAEELEQARRRELGRLFFGMGETDSEQKRFTIYNLKGLMMPDKDSETPMSEWQPDELLSRPIMTLAAWHALQIVYRSDPHERKAFALDEAHEVVSGAGGAGRQLVYKLATDSRKNNCAGLVASQNAGVVLGQDVANFVGSAFIGRTTGDDAAKDAIQLLGKAPESGYEQILYGLSPKVPGKQLDYREFVFRDGAGADGRSGLEKIRVSLDHHPELKAALNTTASPDQKASLRMRKEAAAQEAI